MGLRVRRAQRGRVRLHRSRSRDQKQADSLPGAHHRGELLSPVQHRSGGDRHLSGSRDRGVRGRLEAGGAALPGLVFAPRRDHAARRLGAAHRRPRRRLVREARADQPRGLSARDAAARPLRGSAGAVPRGAGGLPGVRLPLQPVAAHGDHRQAHAVDRRRQRGPGGPGRSRGAARRDPQDPRTGLPLHLLRRGLLVPGRRRDRAPPGCARVGGDEPRRLQPRRLYPRGRGAGLRAAAPVHRLRRVAGAPGADRGAPGAGDRRRRGAARLAGVLRLPLLPPGAPARESVRLQPLAAADAGEGGGGGAPGEPRTACSPPRAVRTSSAATSTAPSPSSSSRSGWR